MSTNKFSKYVIDNIVVGTPISSIVAAGATIGLDSAAVTALIDSDYVQQRETSGLDSAEVIALIDSDYVSSRTPTANGGGLDSAAALDLFAYGIEEVGVNQRQAAISLNTFVDPFNQTGNTDRAFNLNYTSTTGMFIRETGGRTEIHADASGTGQSTGLLLLGASFGNNGTEIVGNVKLSSLPTSDPSEAGLLWNDGGIPVFSGSTAPTGGTGLDSAAVEGIVDSDYVAARAPAGETYSIDETGRNNTADWIQFIGSGVASGQDQVFLKSRDTGNTWRGTAGQGGFQFDLLTANQALVMEDGSTGVKLVGRQFETGGEEGLEIHGVSQSATNSTIRMITNNKTSVKVTDGSFELPSIPTADPANTDEVWADNGVLVMSGFTAPTGGGGLDSAAVQGVVDDNLLGGVSNTGVVIGPSATADATKLQMTVIGPSATTNGAYNVAIGRSASVQSGEENAVAIGNQARAGFSTGGLGGVSIGNSSTVQYDYGVAVGMLAEVKNLNGVALGYQAEVTGSIGIAIGSNALATQTNGVAIGKGATASQVNSIAIGGDNNTFARSLASICIGEDADNADATNNYSIVIGKDASVTGTNNPDTVTIGRASRAGGSYAIGLGYLSRADAENALVINASGTNREVTSQYGIDIRTSAAGSLTYDTTNDWTFGAGVTMTDLTASGVVIFSALPTSDPVNAGQLWNDGGTLKVSAG